MDYQVAESLSMKHCFSKFSGTLNILTFICILFRYELSSRKHFKGKDVGRERKKTTAENEKCFSFL